MVPLAEALFSQCEWDLQSHFGNQSSIGNRQSTMNRQSSIVNRQSALPPTPGAPFCWRIRFHPTAPAGAQVVREFADPRQTFAILETLPEGELPPAESNDDLLMIGVPATGKDS